MADVGVVKYKVELDDSDVGKQADKTQSTLTSKFGGAAAKVGKAALAASTAVATAATAAVADITKQAVSAYADYEQLTGGISKLFEDNAHFVVANSEKAFQTVGMSSNQYMQTVTGFSAALINSLEGDTKEAAAMADVAMRDIADNANTFGKYTADEIAGVYQALAKGQFQTLDNLNLGYGGSKEGMQALIDKANELGAAQGKNANLTIDSFADIVEAIHRVQEDMNIVGTTANEGATTISGSLEMVKASWENVMTHIGSGNDDQLYDAMNNLVESVEAAASNLLPVVERALEGISQLVADLAPQIAEKIPTMITDALPSLLDAGASAIEALANGLLQALPSLMPTVMDIIMRLGEMIIQMAPDIIKCGIELLAQLAIGLAQALPDLIPVAIDAVFTIVDTLLDNIDLLIDAAIELIMALATGLIEALPRLIEKAPEIVIKLVEAIIRNAPKILEAAIELILMLIKGIVDCWAKVFEVGKQIVDKVKSGFSDKVKEAKNWGKDMIQNFIDGIMAKFEALKSSVKRCAQAVKDFLGFSEPDEGPLSDFHTYAPDMMDLYAKGIDDNIGKVEDSVTDVAKSIAGTFSADVGYNLPDIAGYAADLSAMITASSATEIIVPLNVDGREIARASAWYMNEQLAWEAR